MHLVLKLFLTVLQVELLIPQLQFLDDEGAQVELWELSRIFLDTLIEKTKFQVSGMYSGSYKLTAHEIMKEYLNLKCFSILYCWKAALIAVC